ncbi:MAG TPA: SDR family NAD(P)-dependent oxidoreductase [Acidimicrobiales bacterium]|jgi:NAD(P)-dependent dehydrogenase (short-subunit alcohol dehydrogenase family)|nr:SDR family NAD(P)-dependent oxidoreductase [Acidimicrobiales bacterium]
MAVALVTGGSSGIGLATVRRLAAEGDTVFAASRNPTRAQLPEGVTPVVADVADPAAADALIDLVTGDAGRIDVLVNNAGSGLLGPMEEMSDADAQRVFEVNLFGPMRLARAALPIMREQGGGRIINVTSMNDVLPAPFGGWYSASKAALASASTVLGTEVHRFGVFVTVVAPGLFRTEMSEALGNAEIPETSRYRSILLALREQNVTRVAAAPDPDAVAVAIEQCIRDPEPPARIIVGDDAEAMAKLVHDTDANEFARLLRSWVTALELR